MALISDERIVVLIDMDCFFCQVETKLQPEYAGKPLAVVQYNQWQLGGIIAVNYEAREFGITRHMRGQEAKEKCPDLILASVPCLRGKADTSRYRSAGREVIDVISKHCSVIERASVDEAYLDITSLVNEKMVAMSLSPKTVQSKLPSTYVVGFSTVGKNNETERQNGINTWLSDIFYELEDTHSQKLAVAGMIVEELRADIFEKTGFRCSAGISQNKILAKLACGLHKPNQQTILPPVAVPNLYLTLPVKQVRNLGGKFGDVVVESLGCNVMGDLLQYSLQYLQKRFDEKTGSWLYNIARGVDYEPVTTRLVSKSIGACKKFPGKQAIVTLDVLNHWSGELAAEVCERLEQDLEENERRASLLTVCFHFYHNRNTITQSRSCPLTSYKPDKMANLCVDIITKSTTCPVAFIGISAGKFVPSKGSGTFVSFFKNKIEDSESQRDKNHVVGSNNQSDSESIVDLDARVNDETVKEETPKVSGNLPGGGDVTDKYNTKPAQDIKNFDDEFAIPDDKNKGEESPTSRKLSKLMGKFGKSGLIKNGNCKKREIVDASLFTDSQNSITKHELNKANFKESFFMNIFKENQFDVVKDIKRLENTSEEQLPSIDSKNGDNYYECNVEEIEVALNKKVNATSTQSDTTSTENHDGSIFVTTEILPVESDEANVTKPQAEAGLARNTSSTVRLEELFPDLNDIDLSIVPLLPKDLQTQARLYLSARNNYTRKSVAAPAAVSITNSKGRNIKSTCNNARKRKNGSISNFFIKRPTQNMNSGLVKMCTECNRPVPVTEYTEHSDYHVAQKLHNDLNQNLSSNTGIKRKRDLSSSVFSSAKRSTTALYKSDNGELLIPL